MNLQIPAPSGLCALLLTVTLSACTSDEMSAAAPAQSSAGQVSGNVTYRQRIALPPDAVVRVTLEDVSRADAPAVILAEQTIVTEGRQVPIPFMLQFDVEGIDARHRYVIRAVIRDGNGDMLFTSTTSHPVVLSGDEASAEIDVLVEQV